jgi:hypothetical protein
MNVRASRRRGIVKSCSFAYSRRNSTRPEKCGLPRRGANLRRSCIVQEYDRCLTHAYNTERALGLSQIKRACFCQFQSCFLYLLSILSFDGLGKLILGNNLHCNFKLFAAIEVCGQFPQLVYSEFVGVSLF